MIKLFASDMDGTLLSSNHKISEGNLKAIREAQNRGIHFTIVTGRDYAGVKHYLEEEDLKCECILSNGAEYRDIDGNVIESIYMDIDTVRKLVKLLSEEGLSIQIMTDEGPFITNRESDKEASLDRFKISNPKLSEEEVKAFIKNLYKQRGMRFINDDNDMEKLLSSGVNITKIVTFNRDTELIANMKEKIKANISNLAVASTFSNDIEISHIEAQKGLILAKVIEKMGLKRGEVAVAGDSFNDYSLFTEFENSFAMDNAIPEIKKIAKYITDSNDDDGVAKAIYKALEI